MTKRNLFVSIGSTSTLALITLIERLQDLGIYNPLDPDFKDTFIAIETDDGPLDQLKPYNRGNCDRVFGYKIEKSGENFVPSHDFLTKSYQAAWEGPTLKILAADKGVGGRRYKSFATVEWQEELGRKIEEFYQGLNGADTLNGCQIILIATAWGGTASGMFQNVSDFIATRIYHKCGANHQTPFYTVLALPNLNDALALDKKGYQGLENFAYFMRSIQQAGWRGTLPKIMTQDRESLNFIFPELCDFSVNGDPSKIPVFTGVERFRGNNSALPQRAIIVVPTQGADTTPVTIAEQLLLFAYLNVLTQPLNGNKNTPDGKFVDVRARWAEGCTADCPVLIGINMVECQYPRGAAIKHVVEQKLYERWKKFYSKDTSIDPHIPIFVKEYLEKSVQIPEDSEKILEGLNRILESDWVDSNDRISHLKDSIVTFVENSENLPYNFPAFEDANQLFAGMVAYASSLDKENPMKESFFTAGTMQDVRARYNEQLDTWYQQATEDEKQKLNKIMKMIDYTVSEYNRLKKGKGFNNFVVKYCNGNMQVINSFLKIAREEIGNALKNLQTLMLTKALVHRWQLKEHNAVENDPNWNNVDELFDKVKVELLAAEGEGEVNRFIKSVRNEALEDSLKGIVNIKTDSLVSLLETANQITTLQGTYDKIRNDIQVNIDGEIKELKNVNNYKLITLANSNVTGSCPCFYPRELTDNMFHFYVKSAGAGDITWEDVKRFGFTTFKQACLDTSVASDRSKLERSGMSLGGSLGTWIENNINYNNKPLCGMWFGSVDLSLTFRKVLDDVYANGNDNSTLISIQDKAYQRENDTRNGQVTPQCCQTLFEKVAMGAIFGLINAKGAGKTMPNNGTLSVTVKTPAGVVIWEKSSKQPSDLGMISTGDGIVLKSVSVEFIAKLMGWMRESDGSCRFADAFDCKELFISLTDQERYVLTHMRLAPSVDQVKMLVALYEKLKENITLEIIED